MTFGPARPMLQARDLKETIAFYTDNFGFEVRGVYPNDGNPTWCDIQVGDSELMFYVVEPHDHAPGEEHDHEPGMSGSLYFNTGDVDAIYDRVKDRVPIGMAPQNMDYGMREIHVVDPNGYLLIFGQEVE